jgi:hypothetical protein
MSGGRQRADMAARVYPFGDKVGCADGRSKGFATLQSRKRAQIFLLIFFFLETGGFRDVFLVEQKRLQRQFHKCCEDIRFFFLTVRSKQNKAVHLRKCLCCRPRFARREAHLLSTSFFAKKYIGDDDQNRAHAAAGSCSASGASAGLAIGSRSRAIACSVLSAAAAGLCSSSSAAGIWSESSSPSSMRSCTWRLVSVAKRRRRHLSGLCLGLGWCHIKRNLWRHAFRPVLESGKT